MMSKTTLRQSPATTSGRWQARYQGPDGIDRPAPETFADKTDAEVWLTLKEAKSSAASGSIPRPGRSSSPSTPRHG